MKKNKDRREQKEMNRRGFLKASGAIAAVASSTIAGCGGCPTPVASQTEPGDAGTPAEPSDEPAVKPAEITRFRTLGRTGFEVSDVSMGCGEISEANVVRYAYDRGINLFDVAETYGNGDSERKIGEAMPHMDRKKIFIVTKLRINKEDQEQVILDRFGKCLERLKTDYVDALYSHAVTDLSTVTHAPFHSAVAKLKADGKVKHAGISSHGPHEENQPKMDEVLLAAVEDGRYDLMLLVYNHLNKEEGERVLKACKEKNIGTTCMKACAGLLEEIKPFDPENPSEDDNKFIERLMKRNMTREQAIEKFKEFTKREIEQWEKQKPEVDAFVAKHGLKTQDELDKASIRWVLANPDMHTVCVSTPDFDMLDKTIPISGTDLSAANNRLLDDYAAVFGNRYCRHGCKDCLSLCPHGVSVSTVMRYTYYFGHQGREKHAMRKYAELGSANGSNCLGCDAPCIKGCPYGVRVQAGLINAHRMLTLA
ncbi:MAG: twin-arginine translocation signal domain-containing protein [Proteobacteria bacterium]|nr:twin-arginine translocation signal domain-containing protein [Pseudomonadota bacterium]